MDLGKTQISKPVDDVYGILPDPPTNVIQPDPLVRDTPVDKSGDIPAGEQKDVTEEKTSSAVDGKIMPP